MARNRTFAQVREDLRNELNRAASVASGVADVPILNNAINRVYESLAENHDWPHLRRRFDRIPLVAGERYYDLPDELDYERIEQMRLWWNAKVVPIKRGISVLDYDVYNSLADQRSEPAIKWDITVAEGQTDEQIEVWPIPATTGVQFLHIQGFVKLPKLVNDNDVCKLDERLVSLFAAARLIKDKEDRAACLSEAQDKLQTLKANTHDTDDEFAFGDGNERENDASKGVTIRVTARS